MKRNISRLAMAFAAIVAAAGFAATPSPVPTASATAPSAAICNGNNSFCGYTLHVKNGSTTIIPSKSFGAHYGFWDVPASANNTTGIGFCLNDQFTGVPVGAVFERPLAPGWTTAQMASAAYILATFGGDRVSPYQPLAIDSAGEFPGFSTRQRFLAVHLALSSVLPNWLGGNSYVPLVNPATMQLFADAAGTIPSSQQVVAPLVQAMVAAAASHHAGGSGVVLAAINSAGVVTVTATKDGLPVADLPIWPNTTTGVTYNGTTTSQAYLNAQLVGWPSLDYSTTRVGAGVTNAAGQATFAVTPAALGTGLRFFTEEAPGQVHNYGDGLNSQDNLTWLAGDIRRTSVVLAALPTVLVATQISNQAPAVGETITDAVLIDALDANVTADVQLQLFDLTLDPTGAGTPLVDVTVTGLGNGTTPGLAPWTITVAQASHTLGYRERVVSTSDGLTTTPYNWSALGIVSETAIVQGLVTAEAHLRKTVSGDGNTWFNVQAGTVPSYGPAATGSDPRATSHDDGPADAGDAIPVFMAGTQISFQYEVWLDAESTGVVVFPNGTTGVVTDDNGTPDDQTDDFTPEYVSGDDGDGVLELDEVWIYAAANARTALAGERYSNYATIPSGEVHRPSNIGGPSEGSTTPRRDPAGYQVPALQTTVSAATGGGQVISVGGGTMNDTVSYTNLVPGVAVTITGELQLKDADGNASPTGIVGELSFTPPTADGTAVVTFDVPAGQAAGTYVVFESLTFNGVQIAEHADPNDAAQTFEVVQPSLVTTVTNLDDGTQFLTSTGGTMIDEVCYSGLFAVANATVTGELQRRSSEGAVDPTGIVGTTTFEVVQPSGCIDVEFVVPGETPAGTFVVFEDLTVDGAVVASHRDPDAADQTFVKRSPIVVTTQACASQVVAPKGATAGLTCDRITVTGDPGDVVTGTSTAYPWVDGARQCDAPGAVARWSVTIGPDGVGTTETEMVPVPIGPDWEWIEAATASDGRQFERSCTTSARSTAESFVMKRGGGGGGDIPQAGGNARSMMVFGATLLALGGLALAIARRSRQRRWATAG